MSTQTETIRKALKVSRAVHKAMCREDYVDMIDDANDALSELEARPSAREVVEAGNAVKSAWESLPGPAHYPPHVVADWMSNAMKPAIDQLHAALAAQPKEEARPSQTEDLIPVGQAVRIVHQWIIDRDLAMNQGRNTFDMLKARMEGYLRSMREEAYITSQLEGKWDQALSALRGQTSGA